MNLSASSRNNRANDIKKTVHAVFFYYLIPQTAIQYSPSLKCI